ncbi:4-hydroxybenzoate octaprenyltransferase [Neisseriaceae bacterium PsAf]|nr:4-hydroxybenzoate octaprenyltransferase [Neisseriaceae bacterium PsAf]MCV2503513.1 4-hydroxybenzoate octaprenyltransferase [Neisseriaceae bacterium]
MNKIKLQQYASLMRLDKPTGTLLLLWPTYWAIWLASAGQPQWQIIILFTLGTFFMRSAGCVINDIYDSDIDKQVERTKDRPVTTGKVSKREALILFTVLCLLALMCLIHLNRLTKELSLVAVFLTLTYPLMKRFFKVPQFYLGLAFSFGIIMAYAAILNEVPWVAWILYVANIFWTLGYDTVYAIADKPDDLKLNIHTSAITLGRYDVIGVMFFYACFLSLMIVVGLEYELTYPYWLAWLLTTILMGLQYPKIKNRDRDLCYQAFLQNKWFGFIILLGIVLHYWNA